MQNKLIYKYKDIQNSIGTIYTPIVLKERINQCVPTAKSMHTFSMNKQYVERVQNGKIYLVSVDNIAMWLYH